MKLIKKWTIYVIDRGNMKFV